eukprot:scaffold327_cov257-Pinguiococcus_pyrenoidosus.AAC.37
MDAEWGESLLEAYDADSADEYGGNDDSSVDESDLSEEDYADLSRPSQPLAREAPRKRLRNGQAKLSRVAQPKKSAGQTADEKARALLVRRRNPASFRRRPKHSWGASLTLLPRATLGSGRARR